MAIKLPCHKAAKAAMIGHWCDAQWDGHQHGLQNLPVHMISQVIEAPHGQILVPVMGTEHVQGSNKRFNGDHLSVTSI